MGKQYVTADDIERLVIDRGAPEELIVSPDDFSLIYSIYRQANSDEKGTFVMVIKTKVRSVKKAESQSVDISQDNPVSGLNKEREAAEAKATKAGK